MHAMLDDMKKAEVKEAASHSPPRHVIITGRSMTAGHLTANDQTLHFITQR